MGLAASWEPWDTGLIPDQAEWVNDLALLQLQLRFCDCASDLIPGQGNPYAVGQPKNKKNNYNMIQQFHSGYISEENKNTDLKKKCTPIFIATLFTIAKIWRQLKCLSTNE